MPKCRGGLVWGPRFAVCPPGRIFAPNRGLGQVPRPPCPWRPLTGFAAFLCTDCLTCILEPKQTQEGWAGESQDLARPSGAGCSGQRAELWPWSLSGLGLDLPPKSSTRGPGFHIELRGWLGCKQTEAPFSSGMPAKCSSCEWLRASIPGFTVPS